MPSALLPSLRSAARCARAFKEKTMRIIYQGLPLVITAVIGFTLDINSFVNAPLYWFLGVIGGTGTAGVMVYQHMKDKDWY